MYPDAPGYQRHSDTSREAAETLSGSGTQRRMMLEHIKAGGADGATIDECAAYLTEKLGRLVATGTAAARMIELERGNLVSKTPMRRKTRSGKNAVVYIAGSWKDLIPPPNYVNPLEALKTRLAQVGHGHVVPRVDGRKEGCGGALHCRQCHTEKAYLNQMEEKHGQKPHSR